MKQLEAKGRINLVSKLDMGDNRMERIKAELANLTSRQQAMFQQMQEMMAAMNTHLDQMTSNQNDDHGQGNKRCSSRCKR